MTLAIKAKHFIVNHLIVSHQGFYCNSCAVKMDFRSARYTQSCLARENYQKAVLKLLEYSMFPLAIYK